MELLAFILGFAAAALLVPPKADEQLQRTVRRKFVELVKNRNNSKGGSR